MTRKPVILLIEDNISNQAHILQNLGNNEFEMVIANDGKSALTKLHEIKPNVILQDLTLPDCDYANLACQIKSHENGVNVPLIAMAGFLTNYDELEVVDKFASVLLKPIDTIRLQETVKSFLSSNKRLKDHKYKIYIIDDNHSQLKLLQIFLKHHGFEVEISDTSVNILHKIQNFMPDVIISDVIMPGLDGFELCLEIRQDKTIQNIPIILMTSQQLEHSDQELAKKVAANYYITRTPEYNNLLNYIEKCINEKIKHLQFDSKENMFIKEHTHRLVRQVEKQITANTALSERCALQNAYLSMLTDMAHALTNSKSINKTLENVLIYCFDSAGINKGALYYFNNQKYNARQVIGFQKDELKIVDAVLKNSQSIKLLTHQKQILELNNNNIANYFALETSNAIKLKHPILFVPLIANDKSIGLLVLDLTNIRTNFLDERNFALNLANKIARSMILEDSIKKIAISEKRYRALMDNASCGIFILNHKGYLLEINKQGEKLLNCNKNKLVGKQLKTYIHKEDLTKVLKSFKRIMHDKEIYNYEARICPFNLSDRTIEYSGVEIQAPHKKIIMVVTTDITEKNKLKQQSLINDKLATAGILAAGVAHEINNPIAWILNNLTYLKDNVANIHILLVTMQSICEENDINKKLILLNEFDNKVALNSICEFSEMINESILGAERIRDIVKNLKGFSQVKENDLQQVNVHEILNVAVNMASVEYKCRAKLEKNYAANLPTITANNGKLNQVFVNLIINASQSFSNNDVENNLIRVCTALCNNYVKIDIADNGRGIPVENISNIFDPFFTTKNEGTGLGLSICHEIISQFQGKIEVQSKLNVGTTFSILLPITNKAKKLSYKKIGDISFKKILVIDDESYLLNSLVAILRSKYNAIPALGAEAALKLLKTHEGQFDVIVCDLQMPGMNGANLFERIAKDYPSLEKRFIFITGGAYNESLKEFIAKLKNNLLEKPFSAEKLCHTIEAIKE